MEGTVTKFDIAKAVALQLRVELHESLILMDHPIDGFGQYKVPLNLRNPSDEQIELTVNVNRVKNLRYGAASV